MTVDLDDAHREPDPTGYAIRHKENGAEVVALILLRLADWSVVGEFKTRDELDAAVAADKEPG